MANETDNDAPLHAHADQGTEAVPVADIRNVAIIAHVDHGKTTLVDALLNQAGAMGRRMADTDRVMDSLDLEREKGITIQAKNTAVRWKNDEGEIVKVNIVDTPGHADFGGEVERALTMVDGVLLLVDASEGPLPQTRFVLRKTLELHLPVVLVVNKIDRPDARIAEVVSEVEELFLDLDAEMDQLDFPVIYASAREGRASLQRPEGLDDLDDDLSVLMDVLIDHLPAPETDPDHPLQAWVTNLDANEFVGRLAMCRIRQGTIRKGQEIAWCARDGSITKQRLGVLYVTENHERVEVEQAGPGELIAVAGLPDVTIGETLADPADPRPLPVISVDEPSLAMTIGVNTSPLAGRDGKLLTARLIKGRLDAELVGNVSLRVLPTERPDAWEVHARGELQLAVLVETMRREGFELTVGKPQVVTREIDGTIHEPVEAVSIDVPEEYLGAVSQLLATRRGQLVNMVNHGTGWVRIDQRVPARGLLGFRTDFLTETRGTGMIHSVFDGWAPWFGEIRTRDRGSVVADRRGKVTPYSIVALQERATLFVAPTEEAYEGMVVGENSRAEDMDVNICREKHLTNMRASGSDNTQKLTPPTRMSLERALEFLANDECVEVTPSDIRLRKVVLDAGNRARSLKAMKAARS
ncbi:MAG: translational GTPase TypA [Microthrixaceae bacterium]|nr:translational GTPase TypA [Microthrixaceae bacterium]MCB1010733.1 translational GTPase TypA [Microthrixaceae bacterium]MCB9386336.1 translational GTPase TypA [Microthrixaceae bacterium]MCO5320941.1 translational GTPase TypA [Microthrixaceae bacterium]